MEQKAKLSSPLTIKPVPLECLREICRGYTSLELFSVGRSAKKQLIHKRFSVQNSIGTTNRIVYKENRKLTHRANALANLGTLTLKTTGLSPSTNQGLQVPTVYH